MKIRITKLLFFVLCLVTLYSSVQCRHADKRRDKSTGAIIHGHRTNICDITDRDSKVHCYCEEHQAAHNASRAECWVFNGGLPSDDPIWTAFSSQTNLIELKFNVRADGGLESVPTKALKYLRYLRELTVKYASIDEVAPYAFANLTSLKEITLTRNKITELKEYAFASLYNLTTITLDDNRITEIRRDVFYDLPLLQKLYMANNNISVLHDGAFKHISLLSDLELEGNSISILTKETFEGLANLNRLDLRNNRIAMLGDFTFAELWNLKELLLDKNSLQFISERAFDGLSQLKRLSISENRLSSLTTGLFEGVRGLTSLDLKRNHLETLTFENIRPIIDNLKNSSSNIYLDGNNFDCDCRLAWMHMLRNETRSDKVRRSLEQVTCHLEPEYHHYLISPLSDSKSPNNININDQQSQHSVKKQINHHQYDNHLQVKMHHKVNDDQYDASDMMYEDHRYDDTYDDAQHDGTNDNEAMEFDLNNRSKQKHLFQIPAKHLPCPEELRDPTDSPLTRPSQGEVRDYRNTACTRTHFRCLQLTVVVFIFLWKYVQGFNL